MKGAAKAWKASSDPLYPGGRAGVVGPIPGANTSIVRHVPFLEGAGRETTYLSTTESSVVVERFAGKDGKPFAHPVRKLDSLVESAAKESGTLALKPLVKWLGDGSRARAERALPFKRYREFASRLHKRRRDEGED